MSRRIRYGVDQDTGYTVAQVLGGDQAEVSFHVIQFSKMDPKRLHLDPVPTEIEVWTGMQAEQALRFSPRVVWTRKIPVRLKNQHRKVHGFKPLKGEYGTEDRSDAVVA